MLCDTSAIAIQASTDSLKVSLGNLAAQGTMSAAAAQAAALRIVRSTNIEASTCLAQSGSIDNVTCYYCARNAHTGHVNQTAELSAIAF